VCSLCFLSDRVVLQSTDTLLTKVTFYSRLINEKRATATDCICTRSDISMTKITHSFDRGNHYGEPSHKNLDIVQEMMCLRGTCSSREDSVGPDCLVALAFSSDRQTMATRGITYFINSSFEGCSLDSVSACFDITLEKLLGLDRATTPLRMLRVICQVCY
jgi:hypothetical protein